MIVISFIAAIMTTFSFLPQAIKTIQTKDTKDLSLIMYLMFTSGTTIWTVYGYLASEWAIFLANLVTTIFAGIILYYKVKEVLSSRKKK